jgi:hypothetical protein
MQLLAWGLVALVISALIYAPGLSGGFFLDDYSNIVDNPRVHAESIDLESISRASGAFQPTGTGRPLSTISFAIDHAIWGKGAFGYKLTSLAVHLINSALVLLLLRALLVDRLSTRVSNAIAALAMLAWATHPLQISTVLYVVQRMEMLAATFVLLALYAYLHGRRSQIAGTGGLPSIAAAFMLAGLGSLAKESAVLFGPMALALEFALLDFRAQSPTTARLLRWGWLIVVVAGLLMFFGWMLPRVASPESFEIRAFDQHQRVISQFRVLPMYLGQMLLPLPDSMPVYYDQLRPSSNLLSPWTTLAGALFLLALLGLAWSIRHRASLASLGILWFFAGHSLTSSPLNLELAFEHRNYLPLLGVVLSITDGALRIPMRDSPRLKVFAAIVVVGLFACLAGIRAATWGNPLVMASDLASRNPTSARASNDLATIYVNYSGGDANSPFLQFAIEEFKRGSKLENAGPFPEQGLILVSTMAGQPVNPAWWDALTYKIQTQPIGPEHIKTIIGMLEQHRSGFLLEPTRLAVVFQALLDRRPKWPGHVLANFADFVFEELDDRERATNLYVRAVTDNPTDLEFPNRLLSTLIQEGKAEQAHAVADAMTSLGMLSPEKSVPAQ